MKRLFLILAIILIGLFTPASKPTEITQEASSSASFVATGSARVVRVIDGDTIEIAGGAKVRYIGIDAPETVDPRRPVMCFGRDASAQNKKLVEGKEVRLEKDVSETDKYGRLLRYVFVGDVFVNDYLVREGFAHVSTYPPDVKFSKEFLAAEREARDNNRGLWSICL